MPENRQEAAPLGIVAGGGDLPRFVAECARADGRLVYIVAIKGEALAEGLAPDATVGIGQAGHLFEALRGAGCQEVVFCGAVTRPDVSALRVDWKGARLLSRIVPRLGGGDDALLRTIIDVFAEEGFRVVEPEAVMGPLLADPGPLTARAPAPGDEADIARAVEVVRALGAVDVGQGAVVAGGLVLAVEAIEGTDAMLARVAALPADRRGVVADGRRGVLVKLAKPGQTRRADLPTIGVRTVEGAAAAGLAGIAVAAGSALVLDKAAVAAAADAAGLFVTGLPVSGLPAEGLPVSGQPDSAG